jgi:hypothetical protein
MPIDARIPLGVTGVDPNGFINALAAGQKQRELQNASDRLAAKDEAATAKRNALRQFYMSDRGPEAVRTLGIEAPDAVSGIEKNTREAEFNEARTGKLRRETAKADIGLLREGIASIAANPTRENATTVLDGIEAQGTDVARPRKQLDSTPDEGLPGLIRGWGMSFKQSEDLVQKDRDAAKPVRNSYTGKWEYPPAANAPPAAPTAPAGPGPELSSTEDPTYRYFKNRHGLSDAGAFALSRNLTQESGHRPEAVGDGGKAQGLAQWHPDRWAKYEKWAVENGLDPKTKQAQMDYMIVEAEKYPGFESLKGNDPAALREFIKNFEGYGVEGARFSGLDERAAQGGGAQVPPPTMPVPPQPAPVGDQPVQPPPVDGPPIPAGGYQSQAERDAANDARQIANNAETQRIARERLALEKGKTGPGAVVRHADKAWLKTQDEAGAAAEKLSESIAQAQGLVSGKDGVYGNDLIDRGKYLAHQWGMNDSPTAVNSERLREVGAQMTLSFGSLGTSVSNADREAYARAQGNFEQAKSPKAMLLSLKEMSAVSERVIKKVNSNRRFYEETGRKPDFAPAPPVDGATPHADTSPDPAKLQPMDERAELERLRALKAARGGA